MQYDAFSYPCLDQLITHVGRYRWRTGGKMEFPLVVRMPYGGGVRAPELHDDSPEAYYVHTPGVKVAIPSTPADAKGLLAAAIRDPDPVVVLEPKLHYRTMRGEVPEGEHVVPLGEARIAREGSDVTLVAYGAMVPLAEQAAEELAGEASVEVLDLRTPEAARRGRAARVGSEDRPRRDRAGGASHGGLRRPSWQRSWPRRRSSTCAAPVVRVTGYDVPYPYWQIEDAYMPSVERVVDAVRKLLEFWMRAALVFGSLALAALVLSSANAGVARTRACTAKDLRGEGMLRARPADGGRDSSPERLAFGVPYRRASRGRNLRPEWKAAADEAEADRGEDDRGASRESRRRRPARGARSLVEPVVRGRRVVSWSGSSSCTCG